MQFNGPARPLMASDYRTIAGYLGCHVAAVRAVLKVESAGKGFIGDRPIILFEPHVFYRELSGAKRTAAVNAGLAYSRWGTRPYPKTQGSRYAQLERAMAIDETAALKSASWGLGQIMGFNYAACGFDTVQDFVAAMTISEGAQLYAMARFIVSKKLQRHLRSRNWARFAYGYNGSGYAKHGYHTKLADAYAARPNSEKYTPPPADDAALVALQLSDPADAAVLPTPVPYDRSLRAYQERLKALGFDPGPIDGIYGEKTRGAVADYQKAHGDLGIDGILGRKTSAAIDADMKAGGVAVGLMAASAITAVSSFSFGVSGTHFLVGAGVVAALAALWMARNEIKERVGTWIG